ncbi:ribonuclease H-like domain-containing protein [Xylaria digitata]|nr:ribonuclease H-like domain-containing protein [Xylaria digitata]
MALHINHQPEAIAHLGPSTETMREAGKDEMNVPLPGHFSTTWWRESKEVALRERPDYGYPWTSPALSQDVYALLRAELLDSCRRKSEGFPSVAQRNTNPRNAAGNTPLPLPQPSPGRRGRYAALVVDCEMVAIENNMQDLVSISVVDFLTGNVVLNSLVQPTARVRDWRMRMTGVNPAILRAAKQDPGRTVLAGWPEARKRILALVDAETVLIGHALPNDLKILRIAADRVVDSVVVVAQAAFGRSTDRFPRKWGLKNACQELIGVEVQRGRAAHDPLEDALATRELLIWCLTHPEQLLLWGGEARHKYEVEAEERRERQRIAALKRAEEKKKLEEAEVEAARGMLVAVAI